MKSEEVLQRAKEERYILHTVESRMVNLIGYTLHRNCFLEHV